MVFTNEQFKGLYFTIIDALNQNPTDLPQQLVSRVPTEMAENHDEYNDGSRALSFA